MRAIFGALVALILASTATAQTSIEQRNQWRKQAAAFEAAAAGLRKAAECEMPDFPSGWQYRKEVTPTAAPGSTLTNIPVAVTITADSDISANALANGHDILFTDLTDGTTVYPSWRASYSAGTWKGFVLFPSYSSGGKCYVNYANPAASDQSTTAALTGGGMIGYCNFQSTDTSQLVDIISGNTATVTGGSGASVVSGPYWSAWQFSSNSEAVFGAGVLQPSQPHTRVFRTARQQVGENVFFHGSNSAPIIIDIGATSWLVTPGGTPGQLVFATKPTSGTFATITSSQDGGAATVYVNGAAAGSVAAADNYQGVLTFGSITLLTHAEYAYFSGTRDANWHAFWHSNTGAVTLSEQEENVVIPSVADLSVTDSRRYNLSVTDSARYNLTVADTLATDLTLGQEPTD